MGRFVWVEDEVDVEKLKGLKGRAPSWSGDLAKTMVVGESVFFRDKCKAKKLRESIKHYFGKGASSMKIERCYSRENDGWRVWRTQ
ncbi:MAG: hypothetical protein ACPGLY_27675 [Rubripirellula sp.]